MTHILCLSTGAVDIRLFTFVEKVVVCPKRIGLTTNGK